MKITPEAIAREAALVILGGLVAAFILSQFPTLRDYITSKGKGCSCDG